MESLSCSRCSTPLQPEDIFCSDCGYPERGTHEEKNLFNYRISLKKNVIKDAEKKMKNVRILLYVIAGLNFLVGLFFLSEEITFADGIASIVAAIVFLGCVAWVNKQPLIGIMAAFIFWILLQLTAIFIDPAMLFQGVILKVVAIVIFVKGINSARDYQKFSAQLAEMKVN